MPIITNDCKIIDERGLGFFCISALQKWLESPGLLQPGFRRSRIGFFPDYVPPVAPERSTVAERRLLKPEQT